MKGNYGKGNGTAAPRKARARIVHTEFYLVTRIYIANEISFLLLSVFHKRHDRLLRHKPVLFCPFSTILLGA